MYNNNFLLFYQTFGLDGAQGLPWKSRGFPVGDVLQAFWLAAICCCNGPHSNLQIVFVGVSKKEYLGLITNDISAVFSPVFHQILLKNRVNSASLD